MERDKIKDAFAKVKKDIFEFKKEFNNKIDRLNTLVRTELRTGVRSEVKVIEEI